MLSDPQIRPLLVKNVLLGIGQPVQGGSPSTEASEVTRGTFGGGEQGDRDYTFSANREGITPLTVQGDGNVGIGLSAPAKKLHVQGDIQVGADWAENPWFLTFITAGANKTSGIRFGTEALPGLKWSLYGSSSDSSLHIKMGDTERLTIDSAGKLGIGVTNPGAPLHVRKDQNAETDLILGNSSTSVLGSPNTGLVFSAYRDVDPNHPVAKIVAIPSYDPGSNQGTTATYADLAFHTTTSFDVLSEKMRITKAGNVGMGTTTPESELHVRGRAVLTASGTVTALQGQSTVTGTDTAFLDQVRIGDRVTIEAETRSVLAIADGNHLTVDGPFDNEHSGKTMTVHPSLFRVDDSSGATQLLVDDRGLNQIVFLKPKGGTEDDSEQINNAIESLPDNGGIIMLTPGTYNIHTTISVKKSGVKIRGYGGMWPDEDGPGAVTTLLWSETTGGTIVELNSDAEDTSIWDLELSDLTLDGNNHATKGLVLDKVSSSKFRSVHVRSINGTAFELTATDAEKGVGNSWNLFENCSAFNIAKGVVLSGNLDPDAAANSCHNTFIGLTVQYNGTANDDAGVWLRFCDNNSFYRCWIYHASEIRPVKGAGVVVDDPDSASGNYFYHLQAGAGGFRIDNADASPYSKNVVFGYDQGNKQPAPVSAPVTDVQKFLSWIDSNGAIFGSQELAITGRQFKASGKVSTNAYTVTGHDEGDDKTWFCSEIKVGDKITIEGETRTVAAIASDISLTVDSAFSAYTDKEMTVSPPLLRIADSSGSTKLLVSDTGDASVYGNLATSASVSVAGALSASGNLSVAGSLSVGAVPQLSTGHQETGFCSAGGLAAVPTEAGAAWETECPVNFKTVLSQGPSYITITATGVGSVAAVAIRRANGSVDPNDIWYGPTGGGSHTFTGPFNRYGFSLLVASIDDLDQGEPY